MTLAGFADWAEAMVALSGNLREPGSRVIGSITAVLRGYGVSDADMDHALRAIRSTMHGFAMLEASRGFW